MQRQVITRLLTRGQPARGPRRWLAGPDARSGGTARVAPRLWLMAAFVSILVSWSCGAGGGGAPSSATPSPAPPTPTPIPPTPTAAPTRTARAPLPDLGGILDKNPVKLPRLTVEDEIEIGRECGAELEREYGLSADTAAIARVNAIGQKLVPQSERQLTYHFAVLDSDEINAVACPGGFIYMFEGMLDWVQSDDELAYVMGHEIGHVALEHGAQRIEALTPLIVAEEAAKGLPVPLDKAYKVTRADIAARIVLDISLNGWGRQNELDADEAGVIYSSRSGYHSKAALDVIDRFIQEEGDPGGVLERLLSTHPPAKDCRARVEDTIRRKNLAS